MTTKEIERAVEIMEGMFREYSTDKLVKIDGVEYQRRNALSMLLTIARSVVEFDRRLEEVIDKSEMCQIVYNEAGEIIANEVSKELSTTIKNLLEVK